MSYIDFKFFRRRSTKAATKTRVKLNPKLLHAHLLRDIKSNSYTLGVLAIKGQTLYTIEPPWLNNQTNKSCIPAGTYLVKFMARSASGKYKNCFHIQNVKSRFGILIHNGNIVAHTKGCLIIGQKRGYLSQQRAVLSSKLALAKLVKITNKQDFYITIN